MHSFPSGTLTCSSDPGWRTLRYLFQGRRPPYWSSSSPPTKGEGSVLLALQRQHTQALLRVKHTAKVASTTGPTLEAAWESRSSSMTATRSKEQLLRFEPKALLENKLPDSTYPRQPFSEQQTRATAEQNTASADTKQAVQGSKPCSQRTFSQEPASGSALRSSSWLFCAFGDHLRAWLVCMEASIGNYRKIKRIYDI